jgi:hypothetical protein
MGMSISWEFSLRSATNEQDPLYVDYYAYCERSVDGTKTNSHLLYISTEVSYYVVFNVIIDSMGVTETQYYKNGRIILVDGRKPPRLPQKELSFSLSVPPFNDYLPVGVAFHTQSHEVVPPPPSVPPPQPPPPVVIPPPKGPPIDVVVEPPDERPRPIDLPPPVPPEPPIDWRPGPLPPDVTPPPRTRETDIFTLRQFAAKWGHQIDRYALNVPLDGGEVVEDLPEPYRSFWQRLTTHKADIVFERKGIVYVAEIKPRLSRGAIGEAITAHELFKRLYRFPLETRAAVICQTAHPTLIQTASWLDCLVFVTEQVDTGQPAGLYKRIGR